MRSRRLIRGLFVVMFLMGIELLCPSSDVKAATKPTSITVRATSDIEVPNPYVETPDYPYSKFYIDDSKYKSVSRISAKECCYLRINVNGYTLEQETESGRLDDSMELLECKVYIYDEATGKYKFHHDYEKGYSDGRTEYCGYTYDSTTIDRDICRYQFSESSHKKIKFEIISENEGWSMFSDPIEIGYSTTVKFDVNGGDPGDDNIPKSLEKQYFKPIALNTITPTKTGHEFVGWTTERMDVLTASKANDTVVSYYKIGDTFNENSNSGELTLYALWKKVQQSTGMNAYFYGPNYGDRTMRVGSGYKLIIELNGLKLPLEKEGHSLPKYLIKLNGTSGYCSSAEYDIDECGRVTNKKCGEFELKIDYPGNDNYKPASVILRFKVAPRSVENVKMKKKKYGKGFKYTVSWKKVKEANKYVVEFKMKGKAGTIKKTVKKMNSPKITLKAKQKLKQVIVTSYYNNIKGISVKKNYK